MQCACAILPSVTCPAVHYFSTLSHKRHDFREKVIEHKMCVLIVSTNLSKTFFILRRIERDMIKKTTWASYKVSVILVRFEFSRHIFEKHYNIKFRENMTSGAELFHADRQT
jgi:hypothetical protein